MNLRRFLRRLVYFVMARRAYKFVLSEFTRPTDLDGLSEILASTRHLRSIEIIVMEVPSAQRALVVAPHEDDEIIGPGGTVIKLLQAGATVRVVYLTDDSGRRGTERRRETLAVSNHIGYETEFFDYPSGSLQLDSESTGRLAKSINAFSPDILLVPFLSDDHPEHRAASRLLFEAASHGLITSKPEIWAYQVYSALLANVAIDITDVADRKAEAIRMWRDSAMRSRDWAHFALGLNAYNCRLLPGRTDRRYVEAFFVVPFDAYVKFCGRYAAVIPIHEN